MIRASCYRGKQRRASNSLEGDDPEVLLIKQFNGNPKRILYAPMCLSLFYVLHVGCFQNKETTQILPCVSGI